MTPPLGLSNFTQNILTSRDRRRLRSRSCDGLRGTLNSYANSGRPTSRISRPLHLAIIHSMCTAQANRNGAALTTVQGRAAESSAEPEIFESWAAPPAAALHRLLSSAPVCGTLKFAPAEITAWQAVRWPGLKAQPYSSFARQTSFSIAAWSGLAENLVTKASSAPHKKGHCSKQSGEMATTKLTKSLLPVQGVLAA